MLSLERLKRIPQMKGFNSFSNKQVCVFAKLLVEARAAIRCPALLNNLLVFAKARPARGQLKGFAPVASLHVAFKCIYLAFHVRTLALLYNVVHTNKVVV